MKFYTNIAISGSNVLVREVIDGISNKRKECWEPTLYVKGKPNKETKEFKSLYGDKVYSIKPGTIVDTKEFVKRYEEVDGFEIFGQLNYALQYAGEYDLHNWDYKHISCWAIDIETAAPEDALGNSSFPKPETALGEVLVITMINMHDGRTYSFGIKEYGGNGSYLYCQNEYNLFKRFIEFWEQKNIDIITGWNIKGFDLPYLINRMSAIVGDETVRRLSPWGRVTNKTTTYKGRIEFDTNILGISVIDYIDAYKKYTYVKQESYKLENIAQIELGTTKLDHSEYKSFNDFWRGDWNKFVRYNIIDTELVKKLDDKLKLIELILTMSYQARINFEDASSPVKLWDAIISNFALSNGIVLPQQQREKVRHLDGAYVKEPILGWFKHICSLDATSLYPSIIMTNNISPETWVTNMGFTIDNFLNGDNVSLPDRITTPAGSVYSKDILGIMPQLVEHFMKQRKIAKTEMLKLEQEYENTKDSNLPAKISAKDNLQMAYKIMMNSLYGATANEYFRFFKWDHAASITLTGQYILRTLENNIDAALNELFGTTDEKYLIYIDTDSLYFTLDAVLKKFKVPEDKVIKAIEKLAKEKITPIVNKFCAQCCSVMNSYENKINFKLEVAADKAFWVGKKKYAMRAHSSEGVTYAKPKYKIKGLEMVKSSTPKFVREKLKNSLDVIFNGVESDLQKFVENTRQEFSDLDYREIAFPRGANNIDEYSDPVTIYKVGSACPIQVRGVLLYNHYVKQMKLDGKYPLIGEGESIKFIYLKKPNRLKENIIAFPVDGVIPEEFNVIDKIDTDLQFEKTFLASIEIISKAIKWNAVEQSSLKDFFV